MPTTAERTEELLTLIDTSTANLLAAKDLAQSALLRGDLERHDASNLRVREIAARLARFANELATLA